MFTVLTIAISIVISISSVRFASHVITDKNDRYFDDISSQATNNISRNIRDIDQITFNILTNSTIQKNLKIVNALPLEGLDKTLIAKDIENFIFKYMVNNNDIISISIFSDNGIEFTINQNVQDKTYQLFEKDAIYEANGSALWGLNKDGSGNFCMARAILDLVTQKPVGYMNLVLKSSYFSDIVKNISSSILSGTYLLDNNGIVVATNSADKVGSQLPHYKELIDEHGSSLYVLDGRENYVYKGEQLSNGWTLINLIPQNELKNGTKALVELVFLTDIVTIMLAFGLILFFIKRFTDPITQLCKSMENVGRGDFEEKFVVESNDEIGMLSKSFNSMTKNIDNLIKTVYKLEVSRKQAELDSLKMQINPHFLYNTLETINWMARLKNNINITIVTTALGEFLRASVHQNDFITVTEEIRNINNYLTIQQYRFGDKIKTEILVDDKCYHELIPGFILQPLVENAIIHGLEPKISSGNLKVKVCLVGMDLLFTVQDDGVGIKEEKLQQIRKDLAEFNTKNFIGLGNVNKRIYLNYGENYRIDITSELNKGTTVSFRIPRKKLE
ncbi:MAG: sensor histidine kinase [Mahella sp.]|nr:sensor histidine kinase [Mahella sp.]